MWKAMPFADLMLNRFTVFVQPSTASGTQTGQGQERVPGALGWVHAGR